MTWTDADFYAGDGSISNPFVIHDKPGGYTAVEQFLQGLSDASFVGAGYYYKLGQDIDFDGLRISPVGSDATPFNGTIDGNGYELKNLLSWDGHNYSHVSLIFGNTAHIKNLKIYNVEFADITRLKSTCTIDVLESSKGALDNIYLDTYKINISSGDKSGIVFGAKTLTNIEILNAEINITNGHIYPIYAQQTARNVYISGNTLKTNYMVSGLLCHTSSRTVYDSFSNFANIIGESSYAGRLTTGGRDTSIGKVSNCYAPITFLKNGNQITPGDKNGKDGLSVSADVYQQKGFWDGTGVDGTVYLDWDFENVWDWDETNLRPVLRMTHAPIPSLVTGVWVKTEEGWKQSTDLTYMR